MLFAIAAFLKPGAEDELIDHGQDFNEFLGPSASGIRFAGALRDESGHRVGYLAVVERATMEEAKAWLRQGPLHRHNLADREQVFEYQIEVGRPG